MFSCIIFLHAFFRYIYKVYCFYTVKEDTLIDMVSCMTRNVGLVHQMPFSCDRNGIPAASLEKVSCFGFPSNYVIYNYGIEYVAFYKSCIFKRLPF